ncbi:tyrosine-type recombinase/integrase [Clostridium botulinum C]|uniref:Integrase n=2 Tax=Clostridium botulinum TaxID=1491 RepID=A0A9Q4XVL9_CLOBO|nr:site-specific tyrosine recombinase/integron integrase [Clostridium botulinum]MCD3194267.1 tyrosine-type recombinase/integrase [Clostridium botulinum C]MCD3199104.1 tyrosine-type recombinase/integrase [Clostridium botulinum C]MCD3204579.1 tyrosine-type recombinase/integrase [Clostridium botulinum C]MCD3209714.1 tyrosine-type recombinase/integrase [Clostridium botulinum C]MCD3225138.1 tyrosine-type recombinase/integrase [Clostridium botulinum C]
MFEETKKNNNEEAVIKILGKLTVKFPELDMDLQKQIMIRNIIEEVLYDYDVIPKETSIVASDITDKLKMYLAIKKLDGLSILTLKNYKREIERFAQTIIKPVNTVTTMDIRMYLSYICKDKKESTLANKIAILKSFFAWLEDEELIIKNPTKKIKSPKVGKRLRNSLTLEELELLRNACKSLREKALLEFIFATGCRLSEVKNIKIRDINWNELNLNVIGKGNKQRTVYFTVKAKIFLEKYLNNRNDNCPYLFVTTRKPHKQLGGRSIQLEINKIATRAGLNKSVYPHLLRHTFATVALNNNMPVTVIQKLMGHESVDTTMIYAELDNSTLKQEYKKLS